MERREDYLHLQPLIRTYLFVHGGIPCNSFCLKWNFLLFVGDFSKLVLSKFKIRLVNYVTSLTFTLLLYPLINSFDNIKIRFYHRTYIYD